MEEGMVYEKTQQARIDAGLCKDCGKPRGKDGTTIRCRICASEAAKRATVRSSMIRKERQTMGACYQCGAKRDNETIFCSKCREKACQQSKKHQQEKRKRNENIGKCKECGAERYYESNYCRTHYIRGIAYNWGVLPHLHEGLLCKLEQTNFTCFYTGIPLIPGKNACVDHLHSRSQHPDKISDLDNLVWCDKWINRMKGSISYQDFISLCQTIVRHAEMCEGNPLLRLGSRLPPVEGV
jgi:hypothetical protein